MTAPDVHDRRGAAVLTVTLNPSIDKSFSVPRVVPDRKLDGTAVRWDPGGGGVNVARVVHRLGGEVCALWSCGGSTGGQLAGLLDEEGVSHAPLNVSGSVRENLIVRDESSNVQYRFGLPGPELTADERARWVRHLAERARSPRYVVISGSLPGGASTEWFGELLSAVPEGARLVVDTKKGALLEALEVGVYLIKPNVHELEEVVGRELPEDEQIERAARDLIERGAVEVVLVSLGRAGALLVTSEKTARFPAPSVAMRSKVGAGDSMVGGLVTGLVQGRSLVEAAMLGVAAGAAAVMSEGTGLGRPDDTERLFARVRERARAA